MTYIKLKVRRFRSPAETRGHDAPFSRVLQEELQQFPSQYFFSGRV
jgi:hypothetical protein